MMIDSAKILAATTVDILSNPSIAVTAKSELSGYRKNNFAGLHSWHRVG
jgi:hypothetical protein